MSLRWTVCLFVHTTQQGEFLEQFEKQAQQNKSGMQGVNKTGHSCVPEDVMGKDSRRKREENERLKKKSYEVEKLKEVPIYPSLFNLATNLRSCKTIEVTATDLHVKNQGWGDI